MSKGLLRSSGSLKCFMLEHETKNHLRDRGSSGSLKCFMLEQLLEKIVAFISSSGSLKCFMLEPLSIVQTVPLVPVVP